jgi:hypothetical protein
MRVRALGCLLAVAVVGGCVENGEAPSEPSSLQVPVFAKTVDGGPKNFGTHLTGDAEVPTTDSKGQGQAIFQLSKDGTEISYKLIVANIENVTQAHIHCCAGPTGTAGVVAWLYPSAPPSALIEGRSQGVLGEGVLTDADVVGGLAGGGIAALLEQIRAGLTYVNVHTSQFPPGEIRGQLD